MRMTIRRVNQEIDRYTWARAHCSMAWPRPLWDEEIQRLEAYRAQLCNPDIVEDSEFTCPACGSHYYGTSFRDIHDRQDRGIGHCHGSVRLTDREQLEYLVQFMWSVEAGTKAMFSPVAARAWLQRDADAVVDEFLSRAIGKRCTFSWCRTQDNLYFRGLETFRPRNGMAEVVAVEPEPTPAMADGTATEKAEVG
jgi:hypothetical protein